MKRKLFSRKDGTTIGEDLKAIFETEKNKLWDLVQKFGDPAEIIINAMRDANDAIREGMPLDKAIDFVLSKIPGDADEKLYKFIQDHLEGWIDTCQSLLDGIKRNSGDKGTAESYQLDYESFRHKSASILLQDYAASTGETIARHESDYAIQAVYNMTL